MHGFLIYFHNKIGKCLFHYTKKAPLKTITFYADLGL
jgi:hypothetical protein